MLSSAMHWVRHPSFPKQPMWWRLCEHPLVPKVSKTNAQVLQAPPCSLSFWDITHSWEKVVVHSSPPGCTMGNGRYQVNKKIQGECFGRAVVAMSEPSGCVFAQRHHRGWPWLTWWCNNHQEMFCSTHGHASPSYTCQSHNLPCHQALPVLLLQGLRGFHRQRCFTAERLSWRRTGAAPPKQHTAALHRRVIIYRDLVGMCSTKSFTTFKIPYLLFMRDLSNIY